MVMVVVERRGQLARALGTKIPGFWPWSRGETRKVKVTSPKTRKKEIAGEGEKEDRAEKALHVASSKATIGGTGP